MQESLRKKYLSSHFQYNWHFHLPFCFSTFWFRECTIVSFGEIEFKNRKQKNALSVSLQRTGFRRGALLAHIFFPSLILLLCNGLWRLNDSSSTGLPEEQAVYLNINLLLWDRHACLASTKPGKLLSPRGERRRRRGEKKKKPAVSRATGGCDGWSQSNDLWNSPIDLSCCTQVRRHRALFAACCWFISAPLLVAFWGWGGGLCGSTPV